MATLVMVVSWKLWNKGIARVLKHKSSIAVVVFCRIKLEANFWSVVGAEHMGYLMLDGYAFGFFWAVTFGLKTLGYSSSISTN
jgi:hypothetical protein